MTLASVPLPVPLPVSCGHRIKWRDTDVPLRSPVQPLLLPSAPQCLVELYEALIFVASGLRQDEFLIKE
jgi:hypothetical protein